MHALIIEDDMLVGLMLRQTLTAMGFTSFDLASTEEAAVRAAAKQQPDLITADVQLEEGSGLAAVQRITQKCAAAVVYITGNPEAVDPSLGPVLTKPV